MPGTYNVRITIENGQLVTKPDQIDDTIGAKIKWKRGNASGQEPKVKSWTVEFGKASPFDRTSFKGKDEKEDGDDAENEGNFDYLVTAVDENGKTYESERVGPGPFLPRIVIRDAFSRK
jgi:hypothetical protein